MTPINKYFAIWLLLSLVGLLEARNNLLNPFDRLIRLEYDDAAIMQPHLILEGGIKSARGFNNRGDHANVLQLFEPTQNALAMLNGFDPLSPIGQLRNSLNVVDDGVTGHLAIGAQLRTPFSVAFGGRFHIIDDWYIISYLPFYMQELKDLIIIDKTPTLTPGDLRVRELLTGPIMEVAETLGNLDITNWKRHGLGDWRTDIQWYKHFVQYKPFLREVTVEWRLGISVPTAKRADEDKLFAFSFGKDGGWGVPFGMGLQVQLGCHIKTGFDIELMHTFGNTRVRRIKTAVDQSEFLLLQKTAVHKDNGLDQRFSLYIQSFDLPKNLSVQLGYQFFKHGDDEISLKSNQFSQEIANTSRKLDEWTLHQIVIQGNYTIAQLGNYIEEQPRISLFARLPFNGKRAVGTPMIGGSISISF